MVQPPSIRAGKPTVPEHLAAPEATLYSQIVRAYGINDEISLRILEEALTSLQRARKARESIDSEGMTFMDDKGKPKPHPLLFVERDSRAAALAAFRQLNLESPRDFKRSAY